MYGLKNISIKTKLILIVLFVTLIALVFSTTAIILINIKDFREEMTRNLSVLAAAVSRNSVGSLIFNDSEKAKKVLSSLQAEPQIASAALFNPDGEVFATYTLDLAVEFPSPKLILPGQSFSENYLEVIEPIYFQNELIGMIYLKAHRRGLNARINKFATLISMIFIATLVVAYCLALKLQKIISGPLLYLANTAKNISQIPDYSIRLKHDSSDELGILFSGFNAMLTELEKREIELVQYQNHLEDKIVECQVSEEKTRTVLDNAFDAIISMDKAGVILNWNKRAETIFGWDSKEALGKSLVDLIIPPRHREAHEQGLKYFLSTGGRKLINRELQVTALHHNGREFPIEFAITSMAKGPSFIYIGTIRDITERKQAEERLLTTQEQLRNLGNKLQSAREEEKARIAREIHDELGQALTGLKIDLSWIKNNLHQESDFLKHKIDEMNGFIEETVHTVQRISSDLRPRILDILGLSDALEWQAREFEKRTEIVCELTIIPESIIIDPDRSITLFRIYQEALTNVARHSKATQVKSFLAMHNDRISLEVSDNGKGIREKDLENTHSFGLMGIRERVHAWKGKTQINSEEAKGTTIYISIPLDKP